MNVELEDETAAEIDVVLTDLIISVDEFGPPFGRRYRIFGDGCIGIGRVKSQWSGILSSHQGA